MCFDQGVDVDVGPEHLLLETIVLRLVLAVAEDEEEGLLGVDDDLGDVVEVILVD